jgi:beta-glucosidase
VPVFYNYKLSARGRCKTPGAPGEPGRDYVFDSPEALYSFGDGLSYTTFAYKDLVAEQTGKTEATVTVTVKNTGCRASFEVVQLYISQLYCPVTPFVRQLRGFEKIWLEPGQEKTVTFDLGFEDFAFVGEDMKPQVEPGEFVIGIGDQKTDLLLT